MQNGGRQVGFRASPDSSGRLKESAEACSTKPVQLTFKYNTLVYVLD